MRIAFVRTLLELARKDKRIILVTGDLGFSVFEEFIKEVPKQYLNAGVAEQNMTGVAAGLALEGKIPFVYSIVPFATMRNFEQIKNDICYQNLNVKIVGVGGGFSYGIYGHTHYGLEDIGILRTLPGITILVPGDPREAEEATKAALKIKGPVYIRLGRAGEPIVHRDDFKFEVGKGIIVQQGNDIALIACGTMLPIAMQVSDILKEKFSISVVSMPSIKPLDEKLVLDLGKSMEGVFTLEEHSKIGGLGSAVSEALAEGRLNPIFKRFGSLDRFNKITGSQIFMREQNGLSAEEITKEITSFFR